MKKKKRRQNKKLYSVKGVIDGTDRGYAFLKSEGGDIFIPKKYLLGAMHGDEVEVDVFSDHGEVQRIISLGATEISGIYIEELHSCKVIPDERKYGRYFKASGYAEDGERVIIRLNRRNRSSGEIVKRLGKAGTLEADIGRHIFSLGIERFGEKTISEADQAASEPIEVGNRTNFTSQSCFTVDGEGSKDFDDAVYAERTDLGYRLWVHIADVSHYVPLNSHLDKQAFKRGNSFYYGEHVIPMLPEQLSNGVCSLNEGENRYTLSVILDYDVGGFLLHGEVTEGVIRSRRRMTYEMADRALGGENIYPEQLVTLKILKELRDVLKKRRDEEGNIDFDIKEPKFTFSGEVPVKAEAKPRLITHSIIEECMIAANSFIAGLCLKEERTIVYRVHASPSEEKMEELNAYLLAVGEKTVLPDSRSIAAMLKGLPPEKKSAISRMTLRSMQKAKYSTACDGHFGLAIKEYCHFTSPIRRYSDLAVHRVIKESLMGGDCKRLVSMCKAAAVQASERERICERAERSIDDLYMCEYMSRFVGENFIGRISGLTEWGVFVELDNTAEGMIRTDELGYVRFDERSMTLSSPWRTYRLGDEIKVTLVEARSGNIVFKPL